MAELGEDELLRREAAGVRGAGEAEEDPAVVDAREGAGEHRGAPDLRVGEGAEDLPEPGEGPLEGRREGRGCDVPGGGPRAPVLADRLARPRRLPDGGR